jgi:hypothetical protein
MQCARQRVLIDHEAAGTERNGYIYDESTDLHQTTTFGFGFGFCPHPTSTSNS